MKSTAHLLPEDFA
jgi:hypothetical protein